MTSTAPFVGTTVLLAAALTMLSACAGVPVPPTYTQDELRAACERHGGWWHPDGVAGGFCESMRS